MDTLDNNLVECAGDIRLSHRGCVQLCGGSFGQRNSFLRRFQEGIHRFAQTISRERDRFDTDCALLQNRRVAPGYTRSRYSDVYLLPDLPVKGFDEVHTYYTDSGYRDT